MMKNHLSDALLLQRDQKGLSLLELLFSSLMLAVSVAALFQVSIHFAKTGKQEEKRAQQYVVMLEIIKNLEKDDPWVPPQPPGTNFSSNPTRLTQRCYSEEGVFQSGVASGDPRCFFQVKAYKVAVRDLNYLTTPTNDLGDLPISRYHVKISFKVRPTDPPNKMKEVEYSFLKTNYARY